MSHVDHFLNPNGVSPLTSKEAKGGRGEEEKRGRGKHQRGVVVLAAGAGCVERRAPALVAGGAHGITHGFGRRVVRSMKKEQGPTIDLH
jgi:hypothetical protein